MVKRITKKRPIYQRLVEQGGLSNAQRIVIAAISPNSSVLELGSSAGYMTKILKKKGCKVDIVEVDRYSYEIAKRYADFGICGSLDDISIFNKLRDKYDYIICADILEHLKEPKEVLKILIKKLKEEGEVVISIPNIAFWNMRKQLFFEGDFSYQDSGLMDRTHLRFFSVNNFKTLLVESGFTINNLIAAEARFPFEYSIRRIPLIGNIFIKLFKEKIVYRWPNLTFYHYVIKAKRR